MELSISSVWLPKQQGLISKQPNKIWNSTVPPFPIAVPSNSNITKIHCNHPIIQTAEILRLMRNKTSKVIMLWIIARNGIRTHLVHPRWSWSFWTKKHHCSRVKVVREVPSGVWIYRLVQRKLGVKSSNAEIYPSKNRSTPSNLKELQQTNPFWWHRSHKVVQWLEQWKPNNCRLRNKTLLNPNHQ